VRISISMSRIRNAIIAFGVFALAAIYGSAALILPKPASASAALQVFSADRAMEYVQALSQTPRVVGSSEMGKAANYILKRLREDGLEAEIQDSSSPKGRCAT
jgi:hypothetical protein